MPKFSPILEYVVFFPQVVHILLLLFLVADADGVLAEGTPQAIQVLVTRHLQASQESDVLKNTYS